MADTASTDVSKMKVIDLRKELKSRGLPSTGDKAELVARLQSVLSQDAQDEHADINLDSDEIDSEGRWMLDDDEKSQHDLDDSAVESINEELALEDQPSTEQVGELKRVSEDKPHRTLKRKITMSESAKEKSDEKAAENKEANAKKIVLNRSSSINSVTPAPVADKTEDSSATESSKTEDCSNNKIKIAASMDTKTRLELRAKRFGLPVKMSDNERKEARKQRFEQNSAKNSIISGDLDNNLDKLKKRAERFGQSVSKFMTQVENKEKIEKRKAKFGTVK